MKRLLYPVDLSGNSSKMLPFVKTLASAFNSRIHVIHATLDIQEWEAKYYRVRSPEIFQQKLVKRAENMLAEFCRIHLPEHPDLYQKIAIGDPVMEILKVVEDKKIDCVVMGTHGRKGLEHTLFGSVAGNIIKRSPAPVITINPARQFEKNGARLPEFRTVLFPLDFTDGTGPVLPYVKLFCQQFNCALYLLHVIDNVFSWGQTYSLTWDPRQVYREIKRNMEQLTQEKLSGISRIQQQIVFGDPATEILNTIDAQQIDLVIMGTHGRKGLESTLFGSVAENIVKRSVAPVMTVNPHINPYRIKAQSTCREVMTAG